MSTKANEIAALERKMKDTSNKTIQAALKKKIERLKTEMKGEKPMTANQLATTLLKAKGKVREMNSKEFSAMIKRLSAKPEYKFLKGMEKSDIERDLERQAKPVGWRFRGNSTRKPTAKEIAAGKGSGKVYFEDRANHSDVSRVAQLKKGGPIKKTKEGKVIVGHNESAWGGKPNELFFDLSSSEIEQIKAGEQIENGHWVLLKIDDVYEITRDGLYMELFSNLEDMLSRRNQIAYYEYDEELSSENGEETFVDEHGNYREDYGNDKKHAKGGGAGSNKVTIHSISDPDELEHFMYGVFDSKGQLIEDNFEDQATAITWANEQGYDTDVEYAKGGGVGRKDGFKHKITVEDKLGKVHDVALFSAKGDAAICVKALQKSQTSGLSYKLKLG